MIALLILSLYPSPFFCRDFRARIDGESDLVKKAIMGFLKYKGYTGSVEFSPEDDCFFGKVQGLKGTLISYEGTSVDEIRQDFEEAVDCYLDSCKERGV